MHRVEDELQFIQLVSTAPISLGQIHFTPISYPLAKPTLPRRDVAIGKIVCNTGRDLDILPRPFSR